MTLRDAFQQQHNRHRHDDPPNTVANIELKLLPIDRLPVHSRVATVGGQPIIGRTWNRETGDVIFDENGVQFAVPEYYNDRILSHNI